MKCEKLESHTISYQSLLLGIIILNDHKVAAFHSIMNQCQRHIVIYQQWRSCIHFTKAEFWG